MTQINVEKIMQSGYFTKKPVSQEQIQKSLEKLKDRSCFEKIMNKEDAFVPAKKVSQKVPEFIFPELHEIKKPSFLARLKRVPSVILNIVKHVK